MKRAKQINTLGVRTGDPDSDLTREQFEGIGRVVVSYNEAETLFHVLMSAAAGLDPAIGVEITSRVNGLEGTAEIIKKCLTMLCPREIREELVGSVTRFLELKGWRDGIIHSRPFIAEYGIGETSANKGKRQETLITAEFLSGVYRRSEVLRHELLSLIIVVNCYSQIRQQERLVPEHLRPHKEQILRLIQPYLAQYRSHEQDRQKLAPLPEYPQIPPEKQGPDLAALTAELRQMLVSQMKPEPSSPPSVGAGTRMLSGDPPEAPVQDEE